MSTARVKLESGSCADPCHPKGEPGHPSGAAVRAWQPLAERVASWHRWLWIGVSLATLGACGLHRTGPAASAASDGAKSETAAGAVQREPESLREPPPAAAGLATAPQFPPTERRTLDNGLEVSVLQQAGLPLVRMLLSVRAGRAQEADQVGVAHLTARLVKATRQGGAYGPPLADELSRLGTQLQVSTGNDHTSFAVTAIQRDFGMALGLLGKLVQDSRIAPADFARLKALEAERTSSLARGHLGWGNQMVLFRELFDVPTGVHPYQHFDATSSQIERLDIEDCKAWQAQRLSPAGADLVVVGSVDPQQVFASAEQAFGGWRGAAAQPTARFDRPAGPERFKIFVVDHPDSALSEIVLGLLGAPRTSAAWPALALATHLLGEGPGSRLFMDLEERRALALRTGARLLPLVGAPAVVQLYASAERKHTTSVTQALIQHVERFESAPPGDAEVQHAARALTSGFLNHTDPLTSLADMLARQRRFGLTLDDYDSYHRDILALEPQRLHSVVKPYFDTELAVVVVGADAARVDKSLAKLAEVVVLDPEKDFSIKRTLPFNPLSGDQ